MSHLLYRLLSPNIRNMAMVRPGALGRAAGALATIQVSPRNAQNVLV